jgi:chemotaxis protein MotB
MAMASRWVGLVLLGAAAALAGCSSVDWEETANRLEQENMDLLAERDLQRQEVAELAAKNEALKLQTDRAAQELNETRNQLREALDSSRLPAEEVALTPAAAAPEENLDLVMSNFRQGPLAGDVRLDENGNIEITLRSDVSFAPGEAKLTKAGRSSLMSLRSALTSEYGNYQVRVIGHTDAQPLRRTKDKWGSNWGLGSARAIEVVQFMETELGISASRLMSASRGEHEPVADNRTKDGMAKNRRVEIVVVVPRAEAVAVSAAK